MILIEVEKTCAGPKLKIGGIEVKSWLGTIHNDEADQLKNKLEDLNPFFCKVCKKHLGLDYKPLLCCDRTDCSCKGKPLEHLLCSEDCYRKLISSDENIKSKR